MAENKEKKMSVEEMLKSLDRADIYINGLKEILQKSTQDPDYVFIQKFAVTLDDGAKIARAFITQDPGLLEIPRVKDVIIKCLGQKYYDKINRQYKNR